MARDIRGEIGDYLKKPKDDAGCKLIYLESGLDQSAKQVISYSQLETIQSYLHHLLASSTKATTTVEKGIIDIAADRYVDIPMWYTIKAKKAFGDDNYRMMGSKEKGYTTVRFLLGKDNE